ncbi:zinc finger MYM-type protein 1-like [Prunus persica]|uniref:zinc finger MYM-type protein 1-like n=1 Tax=Prunus persica TaxID=3760 RepID=UPI0009AB8453|nr:zinc finger MYM-type protein 1-like [Prunus persica]
MERYFKRRFASITPSSDNVGSSSSRDVDISRDVDSSKECELQDILAHFIADPGLRPQVLDYDPNIRDEVRRAYLQKGPSSLDCVRFLLRQGLPFHGHDESDTSSNKGNYLELLQFLADYDEKVKAVLTEQMAMMFRYVDKSGDIIERFVGIQHVSDTTSNSLKEAIDTLFSIEELSISMLRGQGYDGASNMKALVAVAKGNADIATFFTSCNSLVNIVVVSCKRRDMFRDQLQKDITEALEKDSFPTGRGLNQETCLKRPGDIRWNSHYGTLLSIISMFKSVVTVLKFIIENGCTNNLGEANRSLREI